MADKEIDLLPAAEQITLEDLFFLKQAGVAKKLTVQTMISFLTALADGHGGISKIEKIGTVGLVDTYQITLADLNTQEFKVTNGEKGDKGEQAYVWFKYASQEPTEESHSMGDIPDEWIGVYSGHLDSPPDDWMQYTWYRFKGEVGPAERVNYTQVRYKAATAADEDLTGTEDGWTTSIPEVQQGGFLWTRIDIVFYYGGTLTYYSRARYGIDGLGSVTSVNGYAPDVNGYVYLDASMVGALSKFAPVLEGYMNADGNRIINLPAPTADSDPAIYGLVRNLETVIWENSAPTSEFVAQSLAVGCIGETSDRVVIIFKNGPSGTLVTVTPQLPLDDATVTYEVYSPTNDVKRTFSCYRTSSQFIQFVFQSGLKASTTANDYMVPVKIINVRKVT